MKATQQPTLIIMAAGMGSRYGGLKQVDKITDAGEIILDFSLYDAMMAGFNRAVFVIKEENREIFREMVDERAGRFMEIEYAYQKLDDIPEGFTVPEDRQKPWGTAHAVLACRELINGPFVVINADDYYGPDAFVQIYDYLTTHKDDDVYEYCMVGYQLKNTVTENGHVARGVCELDDKGFLKKVTERTRIMHHGDSIAYTEDDGESWTPLADDTIVSSRTAGIFRSCMMDELQNGLPALWNSIGGKIRSRASTSCRALQIGWCRKAKARVKVLTSHDKWYGVTYKEDKGRREERSQSMKDKGEHYPENCKKNPAF